MREIKFRAWDNEGKFWISDRYDCFVGCEYGLFRLVDGYEPYLTQLKNVTIEQFTGLRDKNGREIYEGDIINAIISEFRIETMGEVIYSEYYSAFVNKNHAGETLLLKLDDFEIIGNIHENPELLK